MNILDSIRNSGAGPAVRQIGAQVGLDHAQTASGGALDQDRDGSALDDITGMLARTFGRS